MSETLSSRGPSIALLETSSIARGIEATDAMMKRAAVDLLLTTIVPRGKYLVLVVSSARDVDDLEDISTADLVKLGPFFDNAAGLLGRHQYRLTSEIVRSDRQLNVVFE